MIYQFADIVSIILEEEYYHYIDDITNVFRSIALMTEKEFQFRFQKENIISIPIEDGILKFSFTRRHGYIFISAVNLLPGA